VVTPPFPNPIEVWLDVPPRSGNAIVLAVDAPWRIVGQNAVIATSAEIPWEQETGESDAEYEARNSDARRLSDTLVGLTLTSASCDRRTGDLTLQFEDKATLQGSLSGRTSRHGACGYMLKTAASASTWMRQLNLLSRSASHPSRTLRVSAFRHEANDRFRPKADVRARSAGTG
jgi:hypothetical protein